MKLTAVGTSGSMSGPDSPASCYLIQADGDDGAGGTRQWSIVIDLGSGSFGALLRYIDPALVDAVVLSHLHADHVVDVTGLEVYRRFNPNGALGPMRLLGPQGTRERIAELTMAHDAAEVDESFAVEPFAADDTLTVGPLRLTPFEVWHPVLAYGFRIVGPSELAPGSATLAYTGDTDTCDNLLPLARGADLLLAEAAFQEGRDEVRGIHLTGKRAGELAHEASARRLVLTHLPPWTDPQVIRQEARGVYAGPIDMARPGHTWHL